MKNSGSELTERWNKIKAKIPICNSADRIAVAAPGAARNR